MTDFEIIDQIINSENATIEIQTTPCIFYGERVLNKTYVLNTNQVDENYIWENRYTHEDLAGIALININRGLVSI